MSKRSDLIQPNMTLASLWTDLGIRVASNWQDLKASKIFILNGLNMFVMFSNFIVVDLLCSHEEFMQIHCVCVYVSYYSEFH